MGLGAIERAMGRPTRGETIVFADRSTTDNVSNVVIGTLNDVQTLLVDPRSGEDLRDEMTRRAFE
jgi:hypothetical protein